MEVGLFYISVYMIALGYGGYQPNIATFGADQFDEQHPRECSSKVAFFSYFYLFMNLGSLFSNTILDYFEDEGMWALGFWASAASAFAALMLFLGGTARYRHFASSGNPLSRIAQVLADMDTLGMFCQNHMNKRKTCSPHNNILCRVYDWYLDFLPLQCSNSVNSKCPALRNSPGSWTTLNF